MDAEMIEDGEPDTGSPTSHEELDEFDVDPDLERASEIEDVTAGFERAGFEDAEKAFEHDVEELLAERDQFKDIALRLQADFDNYRKRIATQQHESVDRATGRLAEALLPVLDACEAAFLQHPGEVEPLFNLLLGELRKQGLESLNLLDQPFDPAVAEAVLHEPGDSNEPVVAEVLRSGYTWKGRVLRPAMVKVRG
jgi:molecular chaperone GrpE